MKRLWIAELPSEAPALLDAAGSRHLLAVCRHPRGAPLVLFDGRGREVDAFLSGVVGERAEVTRASEIREARAPLPLHLVLGVPKGPALDSALRMAVEVGATHIHPALTERTVPKGEHHDRWDRILVSAAEQCGRADKAVLSPLSPLREACARVPREYTRFLASPGAAPPLSSGEPPLGAALAIGPEGGFSAREREALEREGWAPLGLGPLILRVDTAVAVGLYAVRALS